MPTLKKRSAPGLNPTGGETLRSSFRQARRVFVGSASAHWEAATLATVDDAVVWAGRGPLCMWPEIDWAVILRDDSFEPVWPIPPRTSAHLWSRRMGARHHDPHDDHRSFLRTKAVLVDEDRQRRIAAAWSQAIEHVRALPETAPAPVQHHAAPVVVTTDEAIREIGEVEQSYAALGRTEIVALCPNTNKVKHKSKLWALHHRNHLAMLPDEQHPEQLQAYKCRWCASWHVGHRT